MTARGGRSAAVALMGALGFRSASGQAVPNRATAYLTATEVVDARAVWVNPGGLGARHDASVHFDLTVRQPGAKGQLGQLTAGFNARGLSFGYQRDILPGGLRGHTYRLGLGGVSNRLALGTAVALYRGGTGGVGWDFGTRYEIGPRMTIGGVVRNVGRPTVRGVREEVAFVPAATVRPGDLLEVSIQASLGSDSVRSYALAARATLPGRRGVALFGRIDADGSLRRRAFAFGVSVGRADQVGLVGTAPRDFSEIDAASLFGVSTRGPR